MVLPYSTTLLRPSHIWWYNVTDKDILSSIKCATTILYYQSRKGILIGWIRSGGACALSLSGYSVRQIQKMGRWRSSTFEEYIPEELVCFSQEVSIQMKQKFHFINIMGGFYTGITNDVLRTTSSTWMIPDDNEWSTYHLRQSSSLNIRRLSWQSSSSNLHRLSQPCQRCLHDTRVHCQCDLLVGICHHPPQLSTRWIWSSG